MLTAVACMLAAASCAAPPDRDHTGAYEAMVAWFYGDHPIPARTFAIDAASTGLSDPARLIEALRDDPRYADHEIIDATREQLEKRGLIKHLNFEDGFLIEFFSTSAYGAQVTARGQIWSSGMAAYAATLTARPAGGAWVLDDPVDEVVA